MNGPKAISRSDAERAYSLWCAWQAQDIEAKRVSQRAERARVEALVALLGESPRLREWAKSRWKADKEQHIGRSMTEERAIEWYLSGLKRSISDVCEAYGVEPHLVTGVSLVVTGVSVA